MKQLYSRGVALRLAIVTASVAASVALPSLAAGSGGDAQASTANTVLIKGSKTEPLHFVVPKTIVDGESLTIVNKTQPKKVGPHTVSLVEESLRPETKSERKNCFPKGICGAIAEWHGVKGKGPVTKNPAKAGKPGWSTEGNLSKNGDSWFTGEKPGSSFTQKVNVDTSHGPTTIHFMCAIHPWMHGEIEVLPAE